MSDIPIFRHHFKRVNSTNSWAKAHPQSLPQGFLTLVTAESQQNGRGQFSRTWHSPDSHNLYLSYCFFLKDYPEQMLELSQLLAVAAKEILQGIAPVTLKHPNDLMIAKKKLGGILTETLPYQGRLLVVTGIGLNVNMGPEDFIKIDQPATSLKKEIGHPLELEPLVSSLTQTFSSKIRQLTGLIYKLKLKL